MQGFDVPVLCDATADVLRTALHVQVSRVRRNQRVRVLHSVCTSACTVEGLIATRTASVRKRAAQVNLHAAPATRVARRAPGGGFMHQDGTTTCVESLRTVRGARAASVCVRLRCAAFATRRATVELLRRFTCRCNGTHAETIAASPPAVVRCAATVEAQVRGPPVPLSDCFVQSTQIAAWPLPT
jgi:hypothetical protein